jgi:hypothetical protein
MFNFATMSQMGNSLGGSPVAAAMARRSSADGSDSAGHEGKRIKLHHARIQLPTFSVLG